MTPDEVWHFWFDGDGYLEAKSIGPATHTVRISSAHQLDVDDLHLAVLLVANAGEGDIEALGLQPAR